MQCLSPFYAQNFRLTPNGPSPWHSGLYYLNNLVTKVPGTGRPDMGPGITHKRIILELYEKKVAPPDIALQVNHSQEAVDRYIKDYERIRFLVRRGMDITEISHLTGRGKQVVKQHLEIIKHHHPELFETRQEPDKSPDTGTGCSPKTQ